MRIEAMTATFGRFDRETLTLQPGLNILTAPNEAGKSTWCAFLLAMLYGIDTAERATKSNFPAKTHYKPWSGAAMEGLMQVVHNGRRITLERTSTAKSPMGVFRAYDTETGAPIPELTADTCGQILLGVPRAVFERSAFIRQGGIGISMDAGLEQRLNALVTTGDERISYIEAEKKLRDLRNRCRHNKTGLIPQIQAELTQTEQTLEQIRQLQSQASELQLQQTELQGSVQTCRRQLQTLQAREASAQRKQLDEARDEALRQLDLAKALEQQCACLPEVSILQQWQQQLEQLRGRRHTLELDAALTT